MIVHSRFVFCDLPKCGTTSVRAALHGYGLPPVDCNRSNWHIREIPSGYEDLPRFAVVRNPYRRALSLWHFERYQVGERGKKNEFATPEEYWRHWSLDTLDGFMARCVENRETEELWLYLSCTLYLAPLEPVTVLHLENLQDEWSAQPLLPKIHLPHERRQDYARDLTAAQIDKINLWADEDFERYGYARA